MELFWMLLQLSEVSMVQDLLTFDLANRPPRAPALWQTGRLAAVGVRPSAGRQPARRHPIWQAGNPRLNSDLGSLSAEVPRD